MGLDDIMGLENIMGLDMMELDNIAVPISLFFSSLYTLFYNFLYKKFRFLWG